MIDILQKILAFAVTLGVLVVFHELGHYVVARLAGVKVLRFSVGFGRVIWSRKLGADNTEWALSAVPLGGYVKMVDEREGDVSMADLPRAFNRQNVWKRVAIVAAGPIANLLLAVLLFAGTYVAGVPGQRALLAQPTTASAAATAGLETGDLVTAVDGEPVRSWQDLRWRLLKASGSQDAALTIDRDGAQSTHTLRSCPASPTATGRATSCRSSGSILTSGRLLSMTRLPVGPRPTRGSAPATSSLPSTANAFIRPRMRRA